MKRFIAEFCKRGLVAAWGGPMVMAIVYGILGATGEIQTLTPQEVCLGVISSTVMAFLIAGSSAIYTGERLPMPILSLIHGAVLYVTYIVVYLLNSWIPAQGSSIGIFTAVFVGGYAVIWLIIYLCIRNKTNQLNQKLKSSRNT